MTRFSFPLAAAILAGVCADCATTPPAPTTEPTFEIKYARLLKLEDERSLGGGEIEARLTDPDARLRARAALALGRIGIGETAVRLVPLLSDPSAYVRTTVAFAIGLYETELPASARDELLKNLSDESSSVRGWAAATLARRVGEEAAGPIAEAISSDLPRGQEPYDWAASMTSSEVRFPHFAERLSLFALSKLKSVRWAWGLLATEGGTPRFTWWPAAWAASNLSGEQLSSIFLFYAGSPDPISRLYGARGLGGTVPEQSRDQLRVLLFDPNEKVRIEAIRASARLGLEELVPDLITHLTEDTRYVQVEVLKALSSLRHPQAVDPLIDLLGSEIAWVRGLALSALARQDEETFFLLLSGIGEDPDWWTRVAVVETLGKMGSKLARNRLRDSLDDPDARVRAAVLRNLARRDDEDPTGLLIERLRSDDPFERVAAANRLAYLENEAALRPLEQAFHAEIEERAKVAMLSAIHWLDSERGSELARDAQDDSSYLLRRRAAAILRTDVRARPSRYGLEHYQAFIDAPYTPQAFIRTDRGTIELELFIGDAPLTVQNFIELARNGFYDGLTFHEVVPNGFIRTGDPRADGNGGPGYSIRSEINERPFLRGTVALWEEEKDWGGSQFFITHLPEPLFDGRFTVFGQVTTGMDVVDRIERGDSILDVTIWDGITSPYRGE
ncbi:MAG TPA: HEAT repeat domain-containing protein [Vicinamibacteria bacterium]|nr:HEAT repeat domain-containing protein [Vicinamibacteria bacterium]